MQIWQEIELWVYPDPLFTSCHIYRINTNSISKIPLKPKTDSKWVFMDIIQEKSSKRLTKYTPFDSYLLIMDDFSKIPKFYVMGNITTEEVMDNLDMLQARF